jgi:SAM-dependent methyltransferase
VTLTPLNHLFKKYINSDSRVLEVGFGSGRDLRFTPSLGAECYGVDSTQGFVDAFALDNEFKNRLFCAKLPVLNLNFSFKFDVVVAIAVIMHLTLEEIELWVEDMKKYLKEGAKIVVSYSTLPR